MAVSMLNYIHEEPETLQKIIDEYSQHLQPIITFTQQHAVKRILLLATGSSFNAALCAKYFFEQQFSIITEIKEPYTFSYYEQIPQDTDLVIAISQGGKSASTLMAMQKVQAANLPVFALTSDNNSPLAQSADQVLNLNIGTEKVGFVTLGFSATILNLLLIALIIAHSKQQLSSAEQQDYLLELRQIAQQIPQTIERTEQFITQHQSVLQKSNRFIAISYGSLVGVAKEFETKFTETVRVPTHGVEVEAYMHGPYLEANDQHILFFIEDRHHPRLQALRDYMAPAVKQTFMLTLTDVKQQNTLALNAPHQHHLAPLLLSVVVQLLSYRVSLLHGIDLNKPIFSDFDTVLKSKI